MQMQCQDLTNIKRRDYNQRRKRMDEKLYQEIYEEINKKNVEDLSEKFKKYEIKEGELYRKDRKNNGRLLKVIRRHELEVVMFIMHDHPISAHFAVKVTFEKVRGDRKSVV